MNLQEIRQRVSIVPHEEIVNYIWRMQCRIKELEYVNSLRCQKCQEDEKFRKKQAKAAEKIWKEIGLDHRNNSLIYDQYTKEYVNNDKE